MVVVVSVVSYQLSYNSLEEAIEKSNVPVDEIFYTTEKKGNTIIIYRHENILSAALIEKGFFGYRWCCSSGSEDFNQKDLILTKSVTNLLPHGSEPEKDYVTITKGVINDNEIEKLLVQYKNQKSNEATIIETKQGRIWFSFSENPINYDPNVIRVYKDGTEVPGWY